MKDELTSIAWEILNGAKSHLGDYSMGDHVTVHREIIGRLSALLYRDTSHDIEQRCRRAFEIEDGYGHPDSNREKYRVFRDGFYAAIDAPVPPYQPCPFTCISVSGGVIHALECPNR